MAAQWDFDKYSEKLLSRLVKIFTLGFLRRKFGEKNSGATSNPLVLDIFLFENQAPFLPKTGEKILRR